MVVLGVDVFSGRPEAEKSNLAWDFAPRDGPVTRAGSASLAVVGVFGNLIDVHKLYGSVVDQRAVFDG